MLDDTVTHVFFCESPNYVLKMFDGLEMQQSLPPPRGQTLESGEQSEGQTLVSERPFQKKGQTLWCETPLEGHTATKRPRYKKKMIWCIIV